MRDPVRWRRVMAASSCPRARGAWRVPPETRCVRYLRARSFAQRVLAAQEDWPIRFPYCEWREDGPLCGILDAAILWQCRRRYVLRPRSPPSAILIRIVASHHHVRNSVGLFDVGHMVQSKCVSALFPLSRPNPVLLVSAARPRPPSLNGSPPRPSSLSHPTPLRSLSSSTNAAALSTILSSRNTRLMPTTS